MVVSAAAAMFRDPTPPHSKSSMDTLREALKGDWKAPKKTKWIYPELGTNEGEQQEEVIVEGKHTFTAWLVHGNGYEIVKLGGVKETYVK